MKAKDGPDESRIQVGPTAGKEAHRQRSGHATNSLKPPRIGSVRWLIAGLLFVETVLNYLDLQTLAVLAPVLRVEMGLTNIQYAQIAQAFQLAYLISFVLGGWVIDRLGVRWGLALSITWWSAAQVLHGFADTALRLGIYRFLLGFGYPGAYLAAAKAVSAWYPPRERAFVTGVYTSGATVGATMAPPLIAWLALTYGWHYAFFITGGAGFVYVMVWLLLYRDPAEHRLLSKAEREYILEGRGKETGSLSLRQSLPYLIQSRYFWAVWLGRMIGDTPWIFYVFWIPKFLNETQGLDLKVIGLVAWIPFLFADAGALGGGWLSGRFVKSGTGVVNARLRVMFGCACVTLFTFAIYFATHMVVIVALLSIMMLCTMGWMVNLSTIPVDVFPREMVGTAVGLTTAGAILGQLTFTYFIGWIVEVYSYGPLFFIMSCMAPTAYGVMRFIIHSKPDPGLENPART